MVSVTEEKAVEAYESSKKVLANFKLSGYDVEKIANSD